MSAIDVPYLPISNFDPSTVSKYFQETLPSDDANSCSIMPSIEIPDGDLFSEEIVLILNGMGMEKYIELFKKENVLLDTFLQLDETDLIELGIADPKDREIIIKNLSVHQKNTSTCIVPENHSEDLKIMKNISREILLLQNYCAYVELQMRKRKLTDYRINTEESACTYLKAFTESALLQTKILCNSIYGEKNFDSLIDLVLKMNNLSLPKALQKSLPKRKQKCKVSVFKLMAVIGFCSIVLLTGNYFLRRWKIM